MAIRALPPGGAEEPEFPEPLRFRQYARTELARGGVGTVFRAIHPHNGRVYAVKQLNQQFRDDQLVVEAFHRGAAMLMDLRHPSIVRVFYDWAEQNDGWTDHYVIMEFLSGLTLHELIRREAPMPFDERVRDIVFSIGGAVAYLHEQDIIHRDIKPENFRLSQGHFKLLDFDTAFCRSCRGMVSQDGMPVGTPEYMSPEQARGASDIDARADVYSFGMLMYEMLTGTVPFTGAPSRVLLDQIETAPHSPRVLQPGIPEPVAEIIMMALQKDRERRFRTIPAMLTALQEASRI